MARTPHAAKTLIDQVAERWPDAVVERWGDPDGLDVYRTLRFDPETALELGPILMADPDERLLEVKETEAGYLHVTFVPGRQADDRDEFALTDPEPVEAPPAPGEDTPDTPATA